MDLVAHLHAPRVLVSELRAQGRAWLLGLDEDDLRALLYDLPHLRGAPNAGQLAEAIACPGVTSAFAFRLLCRSLEPHSGWMHTGVPEATPLLAGHWPDLGLSSTALVAKERPPAWVYECRRAGLPEHRQLLSARASDETGLLAGKIVRVGGQDGEQYSFSEPMTIREAVLRMHERIGEVVSALPARSHHRARSPRRR